MALLFPALAVILVLAILAIGWWKGWSMAQALVVALAAAYVIGVLTASRIDLTLRGSPLLDALAFRPAYLSLDAWMHWPTILSTMFLHADAVHIVSNLVIFMFMALGFEDRVGRGRLLFIFLAGGIVGTLLHSAYAFAVGGIQTPVVGASGGVFAVIGAYATLWPRDKVVLFFILILPNVPVYIAAGAYTVLEIVALEGFGGGGGVARYAHLGGLIGGVFLAFLMGRMGQATPRERQGHEIVVTALEDRLETPEQKQLYGRLVENKDEPELADAWLERLARTLPCERCGRRFHAGRAGLRCACGNKVPLGKIKKD